MRMWKLVGSVFWVSFRRTFVNRGLKGMFMRLRKFGGELATQIPFVICDIAIHCTHEVRCNSEVTKCFCYSPLKIPNASDIQYVSNLRLSIGFECVCVSRSLFFIRMHVKLHLFTCSLWTLTKWQADNIRINFMFWGLTNYANKSKYYHQQKSFQINIYIIVKLVSCLKLYFSWMISHGIRKCSIPLTATRTHTLIYFHINLSHFKSKYYSKNINFYHYYFGGHCYKFICESLTTGIWLLWFERGTEWKRWNDDILPHKMNLIIYIKC